MEFELSRGDIKEIWRKNVGATPLYSKIPTFIKDNHYRLYLEQIPNEACYNFLTAMGLTVSYSQAIVLGSDQNASYLNFLRMMGHV